MTLEYDKAICLNSSSSYHPGCQVTTNQVGAFLPTTQKCRLAGIPIERGGVGEDDAIHQALDLAGDAVSRHDGRGVHGVDIAAAYRSSRMTHQAAIVASMNPRSNSLAGTFRFVSQPGAALGVRVPKTI
jgi:hypothetical protein